MTFNSPKRQLPAALAGSMFWYAYTPKQDAEGHKSACRSNCSYFNWSADSQKTVIGFRETSPKSGGIPFREIGREQGWENKGGESFCGAPVGNSKEGGHEPLVAVKIEFRVATAIIPKYPRRTLIAMASVFAAIQRETSQSHDLRKPHLKKIGALRGRFVFITFYGEYPFH